MSRTVPTPAPKSADPAPGSRAIADALRAQQQLLASRTVRLKGASVDDVHQARVAARRLRSLLRTFRPLLDRQRVRRYRADLRSCARALAEVRESDVRQQLLLALVQRDAAMPRAGFRRLAGQLEAAGDAARAALRQRVSVADWKALCRALRTHAASGSLVRRRDAGLDEVLERVERSWRRPRKLLEAGPRDLEQLHQLRLALKHYRYALEPVAGVAPREAARLLRRLRVAQDRIGEHRDLVLARKWVDEHAESLGRVLVRRLKRLGDRRAADLLDEINQCIRRVVPAQDRWRRASRRFRSAGTPAPA